ncbi:hypothetical protein M406DRAFT_327094 [Cryphonectria parasitica EP155]|uniref:Uncharacterized protein n=1 Tax=Cryphonectria parasitica (strain ATCC 38755 / EP155) TaxID=660469 RepID=A0A9P4Y939_CRYP1|nr:uncharacterized protein M406DRAFT_327094 [Cryphonectria parasitica EP155]KAF3768674.1 hypothetical protein M406DRAFT_327094 [Cryphonectria parasitica EP155]
MQNEYFVPRDGIDREVITADICRYLGNDALVRPGTYEEPQTGQVLQGFIIKSSQPLTGEMVQQLKADSARWRQDGSGRATQQQQHQQQQQQQPSQNGYYAARPSTVSSPVSPYITSGTLGSSSAYVSSIQPVTYFGGWTLGSASREREARERAVDRALNSTATSAGNSSQVAAGGLGTSSRSSIVNGTLGADAMRASFRQRLEDLDCEWERGQVVWENMAEDERQRRRDELERARQDYERSRQAIISQISNLRTSR